ncbi:MAG TPA: DUF5107 domain-containing protein [Segeticoccus sp.]|uniref:DUF5107 domain-containing protein n=1 Tax=Segeticoccus sp. TaxID=2706531 RepID=UPI002D809FF0|nr:DUF5107 domain-containing protein [Segeticoccus sp.]HET8600605.1 DUF5107 domain-containing protein [Segeticoccus sp.]
MSVETLTIDTAPLGADNSLPPLLRTEDPHRDVTFEGADPSMAERLAYGHIESILPYTLQDAYSRERRPREHHVVVLENEHLRATFLPGFGGRLWSLVDRSDGRDLVFRNNVLQPANLALRNAWFAGGVEWNIGTTGHSPTTCSPLHAARVQAADGSPVLRLYEWERMRNVVFALDVHLPPGSRTLWVTVSIWNPHSVTVPMYWWSNIAVEETPGLRVVAPADHAWHFGYSRELRRVPVADSTATDWSYPERREDAGDWFFDIPEGTSPWIAAVDESGRGLAQLSTSRLRGRKLFVWGQRVGGRRWNHWLTDGSQTYCEIQAGLAGTQLEHLPMPAHAVWRWTEGYTSVVADPARVHSSDWGEATAAVAASLHPLTDGSLQEAVRVANRTADCRPEERLVAGSGWGALEQLLRRDEPGFHLPAATPFDRDTLAEEQAPWLELLETGQFTAAPPRTFVVGPQWRRRLQAAPANWARSLHLGVADWHAGDRDSARAAWESSLASRPNPWALRNLAVSDHAAGDTARAVERMVEAQRLAPELTGLLVECLAQLIAAGRAAEALRMVDRVAPDQRQHGRVRLLQASAAGQTGDWEQVRRILAEGLEVADLREADHSLSDLWDAYRAAEKDGTQRSSAGALPEEVPAEYDFRMRQ